jgi:predicted glycosyltransferase
LWCPDISQKIRDEYACETLRFERDRLDVKAAAASCDAAILNGTHGTFCQVLLAGKPMLNIPLQPEQEIGAQRVQELGASLTLPATTTDPQAIMEALDQLLTDNRYREAASRFAQAHADFDPAAERAEMVERLIELLPRRERMTSGSGQLSVVSCQIGNTPADQRPVTTDNPVVR